MSKFYLAIIILLGTLLSNSIVGQIQTDTDFSMNCGRTEFYEKLRLQVEPIMGFKW